MFTRECHSVRTHVAYPNLDFAKLVCSLLVVLIHTSPLEHISELGHFYLDHVITRIAVPLFFAMSGFLFFGRLDYADGCIAKTRENFGRLIRTTRKNALLYVIWSAIYLSVTLPEWYAIGWWGLAAVKDWLTSFLFSGSYYHLWYLLALILAIPVLYLLLTVIPVTRIGFVTSGLWVLECLVYSYSWIGVDQIPLVAFISSRMPILFDALLRAVPLIAVGTILSQRQIKTVRASACIGAFLLCAAEASVLYFSTPNASNLSYLFSTPLMVWFVLSGLIAWKQLPLSSRQQFCLRDMSLSIYCIHPMVCWLCEQLSVPSGIPFWMAVTAVSVAAAYLWTTRTRFHQKRRM